MKQISRARDNRVFRANTAEYLYVGSEILPQYDRQKTEFIATLNCHNMHTVWLDDKRTGRNDQGGSWLRESELHIGIHAWK